MLSVSSMLILFNGSVFCAKLSILFYVKFLNTQVVVLPIIRLCPQTFVSRELKQISKKNALSKSYYQQYHSGCNPHRSASVAAHLYNASILNMAIFIVVQNRLHNQPIAILLSWVNSLHKSRNLVLSRKFNRALITTNDAWVKLSIYRLLQYIGELMPFQQHFISVNTNQYLRQM